MGNNNRDDKKNKDPWKRHSLGLPSSGEKIWLDKDGKLATNRNQIGNINNKYSDNIEYVEKTLRNRIATERSANKLNDYIERKGYSLTGKKGAPVIGYKPVWIEPERDFAGGPGLQFNYTPGRREYIPIYAGKPEKQKGDGGSGKGDGGSGRGYGQGEGGDSSSNSSTWADPFTGNASETPVESTVSVPEVQNWGIEEQIAEQRAAEIARRAAEAAAFENILQGMSNGNNPRAYTYSPSAAVNPNPSAWENVLSEWEV